MFGVGVYVESVGLSVKTYDVSIVFATGALVKDITNVFRNSNL